MRTLDKKNLTPLQSEALQVIQNVARNRVAKLSYADLADALSTKKKRVSKPTAQRLLNSLKKKSRLTFTPGASYRKSEIYLSPDVKSA